MKIQKHLNAREPNLSKFGHRASGIGHRASGIGHRASGKRSGFVVALIVSALSSLFIPLEQAQTQLFLTINPLQSDTNNTTVWTFSGSSTDHPLFGINSTSIKTVLSQDFDWQNSGGIVPFSSSGDLLFPTNALARYLPSAPSNNHLLTANTNSLPQITTPSSTRTISHIHLRNDETFDALGIRVAGSALNYSTNNAVSWSGQGTLPYPINDF